MICWRERLHERKGAESDYQKERANGGGDRSRDRKHGSYDSASLAVRSTYRIWLCLYVLNNVQQPIENL